MKNTNCKIEGTYPNRNGGDMAKVGGRTPKNIGSYDPHLAWAGGR